MKSSTDLFTDRDLEQIQKRGSQVADIETQISYFQQGFPFLAVKAAATVGQGIVQLDNQALETYIALFEKESTKKKLLKFVPASGAASRMFKSLFAALEEGKKDASVEQFLEKVGKFAFYPSLKAVQLGEGDIATIQALLGEEGLQYGQMPKGLLEFHAYPDGVRTAVEEHLVEGALYAASQGKVRLHFTVSPEHKKKFKSLIQKVLPVYEAKFQVKYQISFSEQKPSTDTIAVDGKNNSFRQADGSLLFRPAGHGALLENLHDQEADVIFIKNIDNVVPDHLKDTTVQYKKALAGLLLSYQKQLFKFAKRLEKPEVTTYTVQQVARFLKNELGIQPPKGYRTWPMEEKLAYVRRKVNRPLRVCGMVKNVGEPGGGPFWAKNPDGSVSLQIVESAQINLKNARQKQIFQEASHFNPVDLICAPKNHKKEKFSLLDFRDPQTGFITEKSQSGKSLKAQELPGLWNGSMSDWNTLFVEVPLITFNPVKTVNDLLRPEHQPAT